MRILQLIDSLEAGGAERMAVNYANALHHKFLFSGLCATRKEGALKEALLPEINYLFLDKKKAIDFKALFRLRSFVRKNKIEFLHAHSSSFFLAVLLKFTYPKVKIVWHDHYGARFLQAKNKNLILKFSSFFFYRVLTINLENKKWLENVLLSKKVSYFPNFISEKNESTGLTELQGEYGKRIVFLANLKNPKNHLQFLKAFNESQCALNGWTLHLVGKNYHDAYSETLENYILTNNLSNIVFLYGSRTDTFNILNQASVGVLCSTYEGFPVSLLEYGYSKLAVLSTNVGFCSTIIEDKKNGLLFSPNNINEIIEAIRYVISNDGERKIMGINLKRTVANNYTDKAVMESFVKFLNSK